MQHDFRHWFSRKKLRIEANDAAETKMILNAASDFQTVESYKGVRTNIMFSLPKSENSKKILITSSEPGTGKTTTAINLAITFAQTGAKVLLLDCDMRKPRVHRYLKRENTIGMSNVLCGYATLDEAIQKDVAEGLDCIFAGNIPPNPVELLASEEMAHILSMLHTRYDYIFIDTPPLTVVTDAALVMAHCTGVILVTRLGMTGYELLDQAVDMLRRIDVRVLGFLVLHDGAGRKRFGGYGKGYKYRYENAYADSLERRRKKND